MTTEQVPDFKYGEGDNIPVVRPTLRDPVTGQPLDLTGCSATVKVANQEGGSVSVRTVTMDPDQVNNKGRCTFTFFDVGVSTPGTYEARLKLVDAGGNRMSFDGERLLIVLVTRDPGSAG